MTFLLDNNLSERIALGMRGFGEQVQHLKEHFSEDAPDEEWLAEAGRRGWTVITRDLRIRYRPLEIAAIKEHSVGVIVLAGKKLRAWDLIEMTVRNWRKIAELAEQSTPPFMFQVSRGGKVRRLSF